MVMSEEQFTAEQLRREIDRINDEHQLEIRAKDNQITVLKQDLRTKRRVETVVHAEYTTKYFPQFIIQILNMLDSSKQFSFRYIKLMSYMNFILVSSFGLIIHFYSKRILTIYFPLWLVGFMSTLITFTWNWNFTVGPLGYVMGLRPRYMESEQ